jgi:glycosyltransferase 2 family protein
MGARPDHLLRPSVEPPAARHSGRVLKPPLRARLRPSAASAGWALTGGGVLVTVALCYIAVRDVRVSETWDALSRSQLIWLAPASIVFALSIFLRALRWRMLFEPAHRPGMNTATRSLLVGYLFNNLFPARAGEAARIVHAHREAGVPRAEALATVVVERIFDVVSLLLLLFVAVPLLPSVTWFRQAALLAAVVAVIVVVLVVALAILGDRPIRALMRPLRFLPRERVEFAVQNTSRGLVALRRPAVALGAFAATTLSWLVMGVSFWLLMCGFDFRVDASAALLVLVTVNLTMIVPSGPAALGVFEAGTVVALHAYRVPQSEALSYALVLHALNFFPFIVAGSWVLFGPTAAPRLRSPTIVDHRMPS